MKVGDKGQRYAVQYTLGDEIITLGYSPGEEGAERMAAAWRLHPSKPIVWVVDRKIQISAPVRNVGNFRREGLPKGAVKVDRSTPFGNPFPLVNEGFRRSCLERFGEYALGRMAKDPEWALAVRALRGKRLICWCAPKACHADILQCLAEENP